MYRFDVNHPRPPDSWAAQARGGGSERSLRCPLLRVRPSGCGSSHRWASGGSCGDGECPARGCFPSPPVQRSGTPRVGRRSLLCACWPGLNRAESIKKKEVQLCPWKKEVQLCPAFLLIFLESLWHFIFKKISFNWRMWSVCFGPLSSSYLPWFGKNGSRWNLF